MLERTLKPFSFLANFPCAENPCGFKFCGAFFPTTGFKTIFVVKLLQILNDFVVFWALGPNSNHRFCGLFSRTFFTEFTLNIFAIPFHEQNP